MESLVENCGEVGGKEERSVVAGLERDDEVFEEAREHLPHMKAVVGDVNEEEVYVTPVVDSVPRSGVEEGTTFYEANGVTCVEDVNGDGSVHTEDVVCVGGVKPSVFSGGKTYAEVLVVKWDDSGDRKGDLADIVDVGNGVEKSEIHTVEDEVEGKETSQIDGLREQTSESTKIETNNEESNPGDYTNGVLSVDGGHIEELKGGPPRSSSSTLIDGVDQKSSSLAMSGSDQEAAEGENIIRDYTSIEIEVEEEMPEEYRALDAIRLATDTNEDEECVYDDEFGGVDHHFQITRSDMLKSSYSGTFTTPPIYDAVFENGAPASYCDVNAQVKEVDSQSLSHISNETTAESEVHIGNVSVIAADQTVQDAEEANNMEDIDVALDPCNAIENHSHGSTAVKVIRVDQPDLVADFLSDPTSNAEIQCELHTVSDVTQTNQASSVSEVLESKYLTDKALKQHNKVQGTPESVSNLLSEQPSEAEIQDKLHTVSDRFRSNQASSKVLEDKELKQQNTAQEIPASAPSSSSDKSPTHPVRPAGLGGAAPLLEPAPRVVQQSRVNGSISQTQAQLVEEAANTENEENDETREKLQMIRVKFLRLARRLGQTPHNVVVAQVLYRLGLAEQLRGRTGGRVAAFSFDRASDMAEQLEAVGQEPLDFSCTIMVLGKTGVGKSATINSVFDDVKFGTNAFQSGTKKVQDVVGTVQGIKVRVIDTPGLLTSWSDQSQNERILQSVKQFIKKTPPDIVLYLDRLDMQSREFNDMLLLRTITRVFGPSIWFNAIVVLTHAGSAPPDGPNGTASNYDTFVTQRSLTVQHAVRQAAGDIRLMNPVSLVENHSACRTNRAGQRVLPNGQIWKPHLLLLSFASKILAEANTLLKLQDGPPGRSSVTRSRAPPLPYLLSSMLQSRPHLRLPEEQMGSDDSLADDLEDSSSSDDDSEYDELPPFKPLSKAQLSNLSKTQKKAYYAELEYREKLLMKKQLKEEKLRRRMMKKMAAAAKDIPNDHSENAEEENGAAAASVPVPMPDLALPASFDSDNPTHRYRYLDSSNPWLIRPVLETQGWDHDVGYEGINVERSFVVREKVPLSFSGQVTKDKKDANVQMEVAGTLKHSEGKATSVALDLQTVGKDIVYTLRSESTFCNFLRNKATAGMSFTLLGDALSAGMKLEDKLIANKRFRMVLTGGAMTNHGDIAYGGSLEATLRDKDHPLGRSLSTLGLSVMDWHGDLAIGCNIQSQIPIGRHSNVIARANLSNKGSGQISIRLNSSEQLQIALVALLPLLRKAFSYSQESFQFQD